ncbi:tetratricopeptide repeat protein [Amycolatopsis sp. cg9]|uniref:tetratricopeptide repeat protein n=1 Tax=Amycolatopsis sp. cg9 TaxID=3238801 RepID=UPI003526A000
MGDDVGVSRRRWVPWVAAGAVTAVAGGGTVWAGLEAADKVGSVVGAVCGVLGLGVSAYGLRRARQAEPPAPAVTNSVADSTSTDVVLQAGTIGGAVTAGDGNVVGNHNLVAGPGGIVAGPGTQVLLPALAPSAEPLPPPTVDLCVGRDTQVADVVAAWNAGRSAVIAGGPGIGKSTVLGRAVTDPAVVASYGARRFVVSCDGAESANAVVDKMALVLGVAPGEHLRNRVLSFLRGQPCVLVLDNFETPADSDPAGMTSLVAEVRADKANPTVVGIGYRGGSTPLGLTGMAETVLGPLSLADAVDVFSEVAGDRHRGDPAVELLVAELDGVPLAITLLATLARAEAGLDMLMSAWRSKRTDLLAHAARPDRTSSLPVSIELSWDRLSRDARTALSLAALLPDGWPRDRPVLYLPEELAAGVIELGSRGLLHGDHLRQRCLAPIRGHIAAHHPPGAAALDQLIARVRTLAELAGRVGDPDAAHAVGTVVPEFTNVVEVILTRLPRDPAVVAPVAPDLLVFQRFTGLGDDQLARETLAADLEPPTRADTAFALGVLYVARGENRRARELFGQALPLYQGVGDVLGEANCLRRLGELEFRESDNARAREMFDQALPLYRRVGAVLGEANCLSNLGELEFRESNNTRARELFDQARPLYQRVGDVLGEANCLLNLGELELRESNNTRARELFDQARPLYRRVGDVLGEANCLSSLGDLEFRESDNARARELFGQARPLYQRLGSVLGEANCLRNLGELEFHESNNTRARELFHQALPLYQRIGDRYSQEATLAWLARLS